MDYWIPASSACPTIDAVAKWKFTSDSVDSSTMGPTVERLCLLQMTKAIKHKCDETILWKFAKTFLEKRKQVCFMVLLWDDDFDRSAITQRWSFRLDPVVITLDEGRASIPLYVAAAQMDEDSFYG
ncbi:hypothetical protein PHYSODRAFT_536496 [Phytophthora sojae]|uniref:Uncharacterized protein n=1 Tax=Phytophthora sojae (strain P6497) TaxID=1094619 RepID=G5AJ93_PHYSP|nr:hypothetical protein PHYSODRAFT_533165 [Phytophthora sojae]XP_009540144.1 hypothetical protein PHYSODRAFT_536496 [Phytophthora sojae]EGZ04411.1 hypothetical protein PHYSODRAFT_536496 [Phytophthora sojae]EGZ05937.1 hypothetical protein PHYSODRAFT_533165 [Phytophthora sojae]|eukprot:XP_009538798.1 hypothetical protein PHYSODRAFT_533165 [Phytophthora sojae]